MSKKNQSIDLAVPVFFEADPPIGTEFEVSLKFLMNGGGLYGDVAKRRGLQAAIAIAAENNWVLKVLDMSINLPSMVGNRRLTQDDIQEVSFINMDYPMMLTSAKQEVDDVIYADRRVQLAAKQAGCNVRDRAAEEWLKMMPSRVEALFKAFPKLLLVIVNSNNEVMGDGVFPLAYFQNEELILDAHKKGNLRIRNRPDIIVRLKK